MTTHKNLNALKRRRTDMGDNTEEVSLSNPSVEIEFASSTKAAAYFRDLESRVGYAPRTFSLRHDNSL